MSNRDILSPPILEIGQRRYRVNLIHDGYEGPRGDLPSRGYQEQDLFGEDDDESYEVEELDNSEFRCSFHVPRVFFGGLIGQKGMTKKRVEQDTKTEITIPGVRATSETLVSIKGKTRKDVCASRRRLDLLIDSLRKNTRPTHFACIPACTEQIKKSFNRFKEAVLSEGYPSIDERLFISADKIHITLATCILLDDEERVRAGQIFMGCKELIANKPPIDIIVRDLEIMNDDASSVSVLYARIESPVLQELADNVLQKFKEAHLNNEDKGERTKLHMTLMNGRYREQLNKLDTGSFDARMLLKKFGDFDFGKFQVTEIHLSQMHSTGENGFYAASGIVTV